MTTSEDVDTLSLALPRGLGARARTDADVEGLADLTNRHSPTTETQTAAGIRRWDAMNPQQKRLDIVLADDAGLIVGAANVGGGGIFAPADGAFRAQVLVDSQWRRRGVGRLLLSALERFAREQGAPKTTARVREEEAEALAFALAMGYREYHRRYNSYLDLSAFDPAPFGDPDAIARNAGFTLASLGDAWSSAKDGDAFLREFHGVNTEMLVDVPRPDAFQPLPFEATRKLMESPTLDREASLVAARDGRIVAVTMTDVNEAGIAYTVFTGVTRGARGKGLAQALKLRAIGALAKRGLRWLGTTNDEANAPMRAVNRKLGYITQPASIQVEKAL